MSLNKKISKVRCASSVERATDGPLQSTSAVLHQGVHESNDSFGDIQLLTPDVKIEECDQKVFTGRVPSTTSSPKQVQF